jgi:hypothetical protein
MEMQEKLDLNKKIRNYEGANTFIISLQKQLKTSKYLQKIEIGKKSYKILSDKQYESAKSIL